MIALGLLPKVAAIVAAIPPAVLGGAAIVMFGTVAVIGIQTLSRVDFHDDRNVIVVAVSLGLAMTPSRSRRSTRTSATTCRRSSAGHHDGLASAIVLNLAFNVLQRKTPVVVEDVPRQTMAEVNSLSDNQFTSTFASLFQGEHDIARPSPPAPVRVALQSAARSTTRSSTPTTLRNAV